MANTLSKLAWRGLTVAIGLPIGIATRKGIQLAWAAARPNHPPRGATDPYAPWRDALGWAAVSAAGIATAQMATTKGAATLWRGLIGTEPPVARPSRIAARRVARRTTTAPSHEAPHR